MSLLEKGSVYEQPSIYNQGGSGGGGGGVEAVKIDQVVYEVVTLGGKKWVSNFKYYDNSWYKNVASATSPANACPGGGTTLNGANFGYASLGGILYNWTALVWIVNNIDLKGFHVCKRSEFEALVQEYGNVKLRSTFQWANGNGTDECGLHLYPSGRYNGATNQNNGYGSYIWDGNMNQNAFVLDHSDNLGTVNSNIQQYQILLCKYA